MERVVQSMRYTALAESLVDGLVCTSQQAPLFISQGGYINEKFSGLRRSLLWVGSTCFCSLDQKCGKCGNYFIDHYIRKEIMKSNP